MCGGFGCGDSWLSSLRASVLMSSAAQPPVPLPPAALSPRSCPEQLWPELEPVFKEAVSKFALLPTTRDYIPPDKDPWLFF